jgi:hypothetical protein
MLKKDYQDIETLEDLRTIATIVIEDTEER